MKPTFVLSGMSCTGKSTILEHSRLFGVKVIKSHTKQLLDMRFGYGKDSFDFIAMAYFIQAISISDYDLDNEGKDIWMVERSILDQYYFLTCRGSVTQNKSEIADMNNVIKSYFMYITAFGKRPLTIVDINNYDASWVEKSLSEHITRRYLWNAPEPYFNDQLKYKLWYFNKLDELGIKYEILKLDILDISQFNPEVRENWIIKNILK